MKPFIAVSGKNGQLGNELQRLAKSFQQYEFVFASREDLNLADKNSIEAFFKKHQPAYFINCAAYTAVDKAEQEQEIAYAINAEAVGIIAKLCEQCNTTLIQLSTDYVFNGRADKPYEPEDVTDPINYYGFTKWLGEKLALENCSSCIVIRTSWLYSKFGNNFVKTMMRLMKERKEINVVNDQIGSPTYAADLAEAILKIIEQADGNKQMFKGIYHYTNDGAISWYEFALAIKEEIQTSCEVKPILTSQYPTPAKRPQYSVLNTEKIKKVFNVNTPNWKDSLMKCLSEF